MKSLTKKAKITLITIGAVLLAAIMVLSGVGIYFKLTNKEKAVENINPLDFSVDKWDGKVSASAFNEAYAGRNVKTKTINSAQAFAHFIQEVNNGNSFENYVIYLNNSIDLNGKTIDSIGDEENPFKGVFDGGHYTIMNAKIKGNGLFENIENATIKNVGLYNSNTNLINKAVNSYIENTFVRLGSGLLVNEFISNLPYDSYIRNSFVDSNSKGLIGKIDTNNTSECGVVIENCYYTQGETAIAERVGEAYVTETNVIKANNKADFKSWNYSKEYSTNVAWCDYDYLAGSKKLDFVYPLQTGFVKVYLTGSCYESVTVVGNRSVDTTNLATAFKEADKEAEASVNLLVEKIFMEARAEVTTANVTINALKDTTIIRGENNADSMFVGTGSSKIVIGSTNDGVSAMSTRSNVAPTITLDGNREYFEENELTSGALVVSYGGQVEIGENVVIKDNINNDTVGFGGAVLVYNSTDTANIKASFENCHSKNGGGAVAIIGTNVDSIGQSFKNCSTEGKGGAIYLASELPSASASAMHTLYGNNSTIRPMADTIQVYGDYEIKDNPVFEECSGFTGGAVYCEGNLIISGNPTFRNCSAVLNGGAFYAGGDVKISGDATFDGNSSQQGGGAIYSCGNVEISGDTTFTNNTAYSSGGAIYATGAVTISGNPTFTNNTGPSGGAIYCDGGIDIQGNPTFIDNTVDAGGTVDASGGAIYSEGSIDITGDCTFTGNTASSYGGAIYASGDVLVSGEATFMNNTSSNSGGAIYAGGDVLVSGEATFTGNSAEFDGGAIYVGEGTAIISGDAIFDSNTARCGGAIKTEYMCSNITISGDVIFSNNISEDSGGAIYAYAVDVIISDDCTFTGNSATNGSGGAIYAFTMTISEGSNPIFTNNTATSNGGAINSSGYVTISGDPIFTSNSATNSLGMPDDAPANGGAIYACNDVTITGNPTFSHNSGLIESGAIYVIGTVTISGSPIFTENEAQSGNGGAVYASGDVIISEGSGATFTGNSATTNGGAIYSEGDVTISEGSNATFTGNTSNSKGGAIYASGNVEISGDCTFTGNTATNAEGGAIYANNVTILNASTFANNTAGNNGGAIAANGDAVTISGDAKFDNNKGNNVIYNIGGDIIVSGDATFESNEGYVFSCYGTIDISGDIILKSNGGTYGNGGDLIISGDAIFDSNGASSSTNSVIISGNPIFRNNEGPVIWSSSGNVTISGNPQFINNYPRDGWSYASAIYAYNDVTISGNATFTGNTSGGMGGAIYTCQLGVEISGDVTFSGNTAGRGSAIYSNGNVTVSGNATFDGNSSQDNGGAIYAEGNVDISGDVTFSGNTAGGDGGAICCNYDLSISGEAAFTNNTSGGNGGAIYVYELLTISEGSNTTFTGNNAGYAGGAIYSYHPYRNVIISGDAIFTGNLAESYGGAVYAYGDITISSDSIFESNSATTSSNMLTGGGAIYVKGNVEISGNPLFLSNSAQPDMAYLGGAIFAEASATKTFIISGNPSFLSNSASDGGAISANANYNMTITGSPLFKNNTANGSGGSAISSSANLTISGDANFTSNSGGFAGAIWTSGDVTINGNVTFSSNLAGGIDGAGAIDAGGDITINNTIILDSNTDVFHYGDLNAADNITLGADIIWKTTDSNQSAIYIPSGKHIIVTGQLTKRIPVYKDGAAVYASDNTASYIFEDQTTGGLTGVTGSFPFHVINAPSGAIVDYNNLKAKYGVLTTGTPDAVITVDKSVKAITGTTQTFKYQTDAAGTMEITSADTNVAKVISYTSNVKANTEYTCTIEAYSIGEVEILTTFTPSGETPLATFETVYMEVTPLDTVLTISEETATITYPETKVVTYKSTVAGTFTIKASNPTVAKVTYSEIVVGGAEYGALIESTGAGTTDITFSFTPNNSNYSTAEETLALTVNKATLAAPTNLKLTNRASDNAKTILSWDAVAGENVSYKITSYEGTYKYYEATTTSTTYDVYSLLTFSTGMTTDLSFTVTAISGNAINYSDSAESAHSETCTTYGYYANFYNVGITGIYVNGTYIPSTTTDGYQIIEDQILTIDIVPESGYGGNDYELEYSFMEGTIFEKVSNTRLILHCPETITSGNLNLRYSPKTFTATIIVENSDYGKIDAGYDPEAYNEITGIEIDSWFYTYEEGVDYAIEGSPSRTWYITVYPTEADSQYTYLFDGFYFLDGTKVEADFEITEDFVLIAKFSRRVNSYDVKIVVDDESNGNGTVDVASVTAEYGTPIKFNKNILTIGTSNVVTAKATDDSAKYTYDFLKWEGAIEVVDGDVTIKAHFTRSHNSYTIYFDPNGGTITSGDTEKTLLYEEAYGTLPTAEKEGYNFNGWKTKNLFDKNNPNLINGYINSGALQNYNATYSIHGTVVIDCKPNTTYTVSREIIGQRFVIGTSASAPASGTTFSKTSLDYSASSLTITSGPEDKYLYVWFYNKQVDTDYTCAEMMDKLQIEENLTATEYSPYVNYAGDYLTAEDTLQTAGYHIVVADYSKEKYTVTFNPNGGEMEEADKTREVEFTSTYGELPTPTREGYTFLGWKGKNLYSGSQQVTATGTNVQLSTVSHLQPYIGQTVTLSFDLTTGESGTFQIYPYQSNGIGVDFTQIAQSMTANSKTRITITGEVKILGEITKYSTGQIIIFKAGYTGTYLVENIQYEFGETATAFEPYIATTGDYLSSTDIVQTVGNHTFVAHWSANQYTVTFDPNGGSVSEATRKISYDSAYGSVKNIYPIMQANSFSSLNNTTLSDGIFSVNVDNTSGTSMIYANFFTKYQDGLIEEGKTYTYVLDVLTWEGDVAYFTTGDNHSVNKASLSYSYITVSQPGVYVVTKTKTTHESPDFLGRDYLTIQAGKKVTATFKVSLFEGTITAEGYNNIKNGATNAGLPTPTRDGYTFLGWAADNILTYNDSLDSIQCNDVTAKSIGNGAYSFKSTGNTTGGYVVISIPEMIIYPNVSYYLQFRNVNGSANTAYFRNFELQNSSGRVIQFVNGTRTEENLIFTATSLKSEATTCNLIKMWFGGTTDTGNVYDWTMQPSINIISNTATDYVPYVNISGEYLSAEDIVKTPYNHSFTAVWDLEEAYLRKDWKTAISSTIDPATITSIEFTNVQPTSGTAVSVGATDITGATAWNNTCLCSDVIAYVDGTAVKFYSPHTIYGPSYVESLFAQLTALTSITFDNFNTSRMTTMYDMFFKCTSLESIDVSSFNTSKVTDMEYFVSESSALTTLDFSMLDVSNVTSMLGMFYKCTGLTSVNLSNWDTSKVINMIGMFYECLSLTELDLSHFNTSNVSSMKNMFNRCSALNNVILANWDTSKVTEMSGMFYKCSALTNLDVSHFNTSNVTDMNNMFAFCSLIESLNVSNFNTSNVTLMWQMFYNCNNVVTLDLSNFDTSKVTDMEAMFRNCYALSTLNISTFDTSNVTNMRYMFAYCTNLTELNVSSFNTENVTTMNAMFGVCSSLTELNVSNFDTSKVTDFGNMFRELTLNALDLSNLNTNSATSMMHMFNTSKNLSSITFGENFVTTNVTTMKQMFKGCSSLTSLDLSGFNTTNVTDVTDMFTGCSSLIEIKTPATTGSLAIALPATYYDANVSLSERANNTYTEIPANSTASMTLRRADHTLTIYATGDKTYTLPVYEGEDLTSVINEIKALRSGYELHGFSTANDLEAEYAVDELPTTEDLTVYTVWKRDIIISYHPNIPKSEMIEPIAGEDQKETVYINFDLSTSTTLTTKPADTFTRTGYTFLRWNTASGGTGTNYSANAEFNPITNLTLYVIWELDTYNVTVQTNNAEFGKLYEGLSEKLYETATWPLVYSSTISFDKNATIFLESSSMSYKPTPTTSDAQYTYSFVGWFIDDVQITEDITVTSDLTIEARFARSTNQYTATISYSSYLDECVHPTDLTLEVSGGTLSSTTLTKGGSVTWTSDYSTEELTLTISTANENYDYYVEITNRGASKNSVSTTWTPTANPSNIIAHTIEYFGVSVNSGTGINAGGAKYSVNWNSWGEYKSTTYEAFQGSGIKFRVTEDDIMEGYVFDGWYNGGTKVSTDMEFTYCEKANPGGGGLREDLVLTAVAKVDGFNINYDLVLDGIALENPTSYTVETETFKLINPTAPHEDYTFVGWKGTDIDGISNTVTITKGSTGDRSYTAVWNMIVRMEATGNTDDNTYSVSVYDKDSNILATHTKVESFTITVGETYTFKVSGNVTSDEANNDYQILRIKLNDTTQFTTYSPAQTGISESTIISNSEIALGTKISFEYLSAYKMTITNTGYIAYPSVTTVDNGNQVVINAAGYYIIADGTTVNFTVNSTPTSTTVISTFIGFTYVVDGTTSTVGVTGGGAIQYVNFTHNPNYTDDSDVGTYAYTISGNTQISSLTVNTVRTLTTNINTTAIPEGESITIESEHGLNKVIDKYTGNVMLYGGTWTVTSTILTLDELKVVFNHGKIINGTTATVIETNGVIIINVYHAFGGGE